MRRLELKLSLPVVAPLLDLMRELSEELRSELAAPTKPLDPDPEMQTAWRDELLEGQAGDCRALLALFGSEFFSGGEVAFDDENSESILRACAALRLRLRETRLKTFEDEALETGAITLDSLDPAGRKAFMCYLFLASLQELIIQHLDPTIIDS